MEGQRFVYDSSDASAAAARAAEYAEARADVTVIDVATDRTRREALETYDRRDVVDTYRELLLDGPRSLDDAMAALDDADPGDGIFVGTVEGQRQVVTGEAALDAVAALDD